MSAWSRRLCVAVSGLLALCVSVSADAQSFYSPRMQSLGSAFSGVISDPITNAFLNPARVRDMPGTQAYLARHQGRAITIPYPGMRPVYGTSTIILSSESFSASYYYSPVYPVEATLFTPVGSGVLSVSVEGGLTEDEDLVDEDSQSASEGTLRISDYTRGYRRHNSHLLLKGAFASGDPGSRGMGVGLEVLRRDVDPGDFSATYTDYHYPMTGDIVSFANFDRVETDFTETSGKVTFGLHRPGSSARELVLTAGFTRREYTIGTSWTDIRDDDADGNGIDPRGTSVEVEIERSAGTTDRVYEGPIVSGRLHADLSETVTMIASGYIAERSGEGTGTLLTRYQIGPTAPATSATDMSYIYEGTDRDYGIVLGLGFRDEEIARGVLVAMGVFASFNRENLFEDASGRTVLATTDQIPTPIVVEADFTQRVLRLHDAIRLNFPVALEWRPVRQLALRLGAVVSASRVEKEIVVRARLIGPQLPETYRRLRSNGDRHVDTDLRFNVTNGLGVYLGKAERLSIDLLSTASSVSLADYGYLSIRYRF